MAHLPQLRLVHFLKHLLLYLSIAFAKCIVIASLWLLKIGTLTQVALTSIFLCSIFVSHLPFSFLLLYSRIQKTSIWGINWCDLVLKNFGSLIKQSKNCCIWVTNSSIPSFPAPLVAWYVLTSTLCISKASLSGLKFEPFVYWLSSLDLLWFLYFPLFYISSGLHSGTTKGTSLCILKWLVLSITTAPLLAASGANFSEIDPLSTKKSYVYFVFIKHCICKFNYFIGFPKHSISLQHFCYLLIGKISLIRRYFF